MASRWISAAFALLLVASACGSPATSQTSPQQAAASTNLATASTEPTQGPVTCLGSGSPSLYEGPRPQTDKASVTFDAARQETVLLTEVQPGVLQTWTWNGATWAQKHPVTSPDARLGIDFDYAESRIVGFGTKADLQESGLAQLP